MDFSKEAIELGKRREREIFGFADQEDEGKKKAKSKSNNTSIPNQDIIESTIATKARVDVDERDKRATSSPSRFPPQTNSSEIAPRQFMHWDTADLLSLHSMLSVCRPA